MTADNQSTILYFGNGTFKFLLDKRPFALPGSPAEEPSKVLHPDKGGTFPMLDLDSPMWHDLYHAYGAASDIPSLLRQLEADPERITVDYRENPWFMLWSSLCHQGDVYTASYAALPHIVRIGLLVEGPPPYDYFGLPAAIEIARQRLQHPPIPEELQSGYAAGLRQLHELAYHFADMAWGDTLSRAIAAALVLSKGHFELAEAILEMYPDVVKEFHHRRRWALDQDDPYLPSGK